MNNTFLQQALLHEITGKAPALKDYIGKVYPQKISIDGFSFYKYHLCRFPEPDFEIAGDNFNNIPPLLFYRLAAASFMVAYYLFPEANQGITRMKIIYQSEVSLDVKSEFKSSFVDDLQNHQIEYHFKRFLKEQIELERLAALNSQAAIIIGLQRKHKEKEWVAKLTM